MGAVTEVVKSYVPSSYRAMVEATLTDKSTRALFNYYDLTRLQGLADYVKFKLFGTSIAAVAEASTYDPLLINFIGKLTTLQFIPAAVDFWGDQTLQESLSGTNESTSYPDRRDGLWKIFDQLRAEVAAEYDELAPSYGFIFRGGASALPMVTYGDNGRGVLVTDDPQCFGKQYPHSERRSTLPAELTWTPWGTP